MKTNEKTTLRSRLSSGLGAQGYSQAVQIIIRLVEVPLLLGYWGTQLYGEWLMLAAIPSYLTMFDGGFAGAASREMSIRSGAGDRAKALSVFQSTWILFLLVSSSIGLIAFLAARALPLHGWLGFREMGSDAVKLVVLILVFPCPVRFPDRTCIRGLLVRRRYAMGMALSATLQLLEFGGLALAVFLGGGPVSAAFGYLGGDWPASY
jgi:hypothetical protein